MDVGGTEGGRGTEGEGGVREGGKRTLGPKIVGEAHFRRHR